MLEDRIVHRGEAASARQACRPSGRYAQARRRQPGSAHGRASSAASSGRRSSCTGLNRTRSGLPDAGAQSQSPAAFQQPSKRVASRKLYLAGRRQRDRRDEARSTWRRQAFDRRSGWRLAAIPQASRRSRAGARSRFAMAAPLSSSAADRPHAPDSRARARGVRSGIVGDRVYGIPAARCAHASRLIVPRTASRRST